MRASHRARCAVYAQAGWGGAEFALTASVPMDTNHLFAHLDWTACREDGSLPRRFRTGYQLLRTPAGLRVLLCVAHAEDPRALRGDPAA